MKVHAVAALAIASGLAVSSPALSDSTPQARAHAPDGLVEVVREATRRYREVSLAAAEGYAQFLGCVSGPDEGAMGVHFAHGTLVGDDIVEAGRPEVLVYEPRANGGLRLVAVEYLVLAEAWDASHEAPPVLAGQSFHFTGSPNRYGLPAFYALHVWAWKHNPHGSFVNWNPNVSCEAFAPEAS